MGTTLCSYYFSQIQQQEFTDKKQAQQKKNRHKLFKTVKKGSLD